MAQPVKLSDSLVSDARLLGKLTERSIAGQIEFWAQLGRGVESLLRFDEVLALKARGTTERLSDCIAMVNQPEGRERLARVLQAQPFPHYEAAPGRPGFLVQITADGSRKVGRFVSREFIES